MTLLLDRVSGGALAALVLAAGLSAPAIAQDRVEDLPEIVLKYASATGPTRQTELSLGAWEKAMSEASGGKIKIEYYWSGALLGAAEMIEGIPAGLADFGVVGTPYTPERFPVTNWYGTLSSLPKGGVPFTLLQGIPAHNEFIRNNPDVVKEWEDQGLKILGADYFQAFDIMCKKPVTTVEHARGTRVRVPGKLWSDEFVNLGFTPVPMVPAEIYEAFSRGIIDCISIRPSAYISLGLMDISGDKYYTPIELSGWTNNYWVMSKTKWDSLPPLAQKIVLETMPTYFAGYVQGEVEGFRDFFNQGETKNVTTELPDAGMVDAINAYQAKLYADMVATAPPQVSDPQGMIDSFKASAEKWRTRVLEMGFTPAPGDVPGRRKALETDPDLSAWTDALSKELFTVQ